MGRLLTVLLFLALIQSAFAAAPPPQVNYQGVLNDSNGQPLSGTYDMVLLFFDAPTGGTLLLTDMHAAGGAITVANGLFDVALGSGTIVPGTESTLAGVFANHSPVYLELQVGAETLSPRIQIISTAYSLNADMLDGLHSTSFATAVHTHSAADITSGTLAAARGGTGSDTSGAVAGSILRAGGGTWSALAPGSEGQILTISSGAPAWTTSSAVTGIGTIDYVPKFLAPNNVGNSAIAEVNGYVGIGTTVSPNAPLEVDGWVSVVNTNASASLGSGVDGIDAYGWNAGGTFSNAAGFYGSVYLGYGDYGIYADGSSENGFNGGPGYFQDVTAGTYAMVAWNGYKITGIGSVSFIQNDPVDKSKVVVYAAPEGDEVATYTRGTARLENGVARVALGPTFQWVTNPDIGLTASVTPRGGWTDLYVESVTTKELVVKSKDPASNASFDYMVYGLRIGFEEQAIVQEKQKEAWIPSMASSRKLYEKHPELQRYDALERYKGMRAGVGETAALDLSASRALHDAIHEFNPAVDKMETPKREAPSKGMSKASTAPQASTLPMTMPAAAANGPVAAAPEEPQRLASSAMPVDSDGNAYAKSFRSQAGDFAKTMQVSQQVEAGDVLVVDRNNPEWLRPSDAVGDSAVVGIVAGEPGVVLGATREASQKPQPTEAPVAISGIVQCKVDAAYGPIQIGDLLTTSATPGYAMRAQNPAPGTIIGKALQPWSAGAGVIRIVIMHQ